MAGGQYRHAHPEAVPVYLTAGERMLLIQITREAIERQEERRKDPGCCPETAFLAARKKRQLNRLVVELRRADPEPKTQ